MIYYDANAHRTAFLIASRVARTLLTSSLGRAAREQLDLFLRVPQMPLGGIDTGPETIRASAPVNDCAALFARSVGASVAACAGRWSQIVATNRQVADRFTAPFLLCTGIPTRLVSVVGYLVINLRRGRRAVAQHPLGFLNRVS